MENGGSLALAAANYRKTVKKNEDAEFEAREKAANALKSASKDRAKEQADIAQAQADARAEELAAYRADRAKEVRAAQEEDKRLQAVILADQKDLAKAKSEAREAELRDGGQGYAADIEALKRSYGERRETIREEERKQREQFGAADKEQQDAITKRRDEKIAVADDDYRAKAAKAARDEAERSAALDTAIRKDKIADLEALGQAGNKAAAEAAARMRIEEQFAERRLELKKKLNEADAAQRTAINAEIKSLPAKQAATLAQDARKRADEEKQHSQQVDSELNDVKEAALRRQAELGDLAAQRELKRLEIQKQFVGEAEKLERILKDQNATAAQKAAAAAQLAALPAAEAAAEKTAAARASFVGPGVGANERYGGLTGAARAARENLTLREGADPAREAAKKTADATAQLPDLGKQMVAGIKDLLAAYQSGQLGTFNF